GRVGTAISRSGISQTAADLNLSCIIRAKQGRGQVLDGNAVLGPEDVERRSFEYGDHRLAHLEEGAPERAGRGFGTPALVIAVDAHATRRRDRALRGAPHRGK